jgi:hypothetical protein
MTSFQVVYVSFAILFTFLTFIQYKSYSIARRTTGVDPVISLVAMVTLGSALRCYLHLLAYKFPIDDKSNHIMGGDGNWWCKLGDVMGFFSEYVLSLLWTMLAHGWSIINGVVLSNLFYGLAMVYFVLTVVGFLGSHLYDPVDMITNYQMVCRYLYMICRTVAGCWCVYISFSTYSEYDKELGGFYAEAIRVLCRAQFIGIVWFLSVPIMAGLDFLLPKERFGTPSDRLLLASLLGDVLGLAILSFLLWPSRMHHYRSINVIRPA